MNKKSIIKIYLTDCITEKYVGARALTGLQKNCSIKIIVTT